jgi:hypothetical protein
MLAAVNHAMQAEATTCGTWWPPLLLVEREREQVGARQRLERRGDLGDEAYALPVERRLLGVALAVVGREVVRGELRAQRQQRLVGLPVVLGEARALTQRLDVEPLEEQELQVARGEHRRGGAGRRGGHAPTLPGRAAGT